MCQCRHAYDLTRIKSWQSERKSSMKIIRISARCGSPCGAVNLSQLVDSIDLENGKYVLSLRDNVGLADEETAKAKHKRFTLGKAKARIHGIGAFTVVGIEVESTDVQDFIDLYEAVCLHLGIEHEQLPRPKYRLDDLSFVRGLRNDLTSLRRYFANNLRFNRKTAN